MIESSLKNTSLPSSQDNPIDDAAFSPQSQTLEQSLSRYIGKLVEVTFSKDDVWWVTPQAVIVENGKQVFQLPDGELNVTNAQAVFIATKPEPRLSTGIDDDPLADLRVR